MSLQLEDLKRQLGAVQKEKERIARLDEKETALKARIESLEAEQTRAARETENRRKEKLAKIYSQKKLYHFELIADVDCEGKYLCARCKMPILPFGWKEHVLFVHGIMDGKEIMRMRKVADEEERRIFEGKKISQVAFEKTRAYQREQGKI